MNSLRYLSERSDHVVAVIMTLKCDEHRRWIPSADMKALIEAAAAEEGLDNVSVYIENEGWLADSIDKLKADGVARSFHPTIHVEKELELIRSVIDLDVPVHLIPSHLNLRSSNIRWLTEEGLIEEFRDQIPENVYAYIKNKF